MFFWYMGVNMGAVPVLTASNIFLLIKKRKRKEKSISGKHLSSWQQQNVQQLASCLNCLSYLLIKKNLLKNSYFSSNLYPRLILILNFFSFFQGPVQCLDSLLQLAVCPLIMSKPKYRRCNLMLRGNIHTQVLQIVQ